MGADLHTFDLKKPDKYKVKKDPHAYDFLWSSLNRAKLGSRNWT